MSDQLSDVYAAMRLYAGTPEYSRLKDRARQLREQSYREAMTDASDAWETRHPPIDGDNRSPLEVLQAGLITHSEFWALVRM